MTFYVQIDIFKGTQDKKYWKTRADHFLTQQLKETTFTKREKPEKGTFWKPVLIRNDSNLDTASRTKVTTSAWKSGTVMSCTAQEADNYFYSNCYDFGEQINQINQDATETRSLNANAFPFTKLSKDAMLMDLKLHLPRARGWDTILTDSPSMLQNPEKLHHI